MKSESSPKVNVWLIAGAVMLPTFMEVLDTTIVSVSMPHIAGALSASTSEVTWVQTSYLISNAIVLPTSAWFSAFFGRKRFFMICTAIFTLSSLMCGIAPTLSVLILARVLQGAGGGALQPLSQAIMLESFPPAKRGQAMAIWGLGVVGAPVLGPLIGGWITDSYSWRWLFYINIPLGVIGLSMIQNFIFDRQHPQPVKRGRMDIFGFCLLAVWLGTMQTIMDKGQDDDWFATIWIRWFALISALSLLAFIIWELRADHPVVNLRVFGNRNFAVGTLLAITVGVVSYSTVTLLPLFLQNVMGYTALQSGYAQSPRGIGALLVFPAVGLLAKAIDGRKLMVAGILLCGAAALMMGELDLAVAERNFVLASFLQGAGLAMTFAPLAAITMGNLRAEEMGTGAGLFNLMRNLGGGLGISLVTTMIARGSQLHQAVLVTHLTPYDPAYQSALQAMQSALASHVDAVQAQLMAPGAIYASLLQQSSVLAYVDDFRWLALLSFLSLPIVLFLKRTISKGPVSAH